MITFGLLQNAMGVVFGITIFLSSFLGVTDCWPEGTYGLPMPKNGCPPTQGTFEWKTGSRTHETETGSHGSDPIHLAGIYSTESNKITQSFCMKESYKGEGSWEWEPGSYCIYKKGSCPYGFKSGSIKWDDKPWIWQGQHKSGSIPDGDYIKNTKVEFCCREDGLLSNFINLPFNEPFFMLPVINAGGCQQVRGMAVSLEFVQWHTSDRFGNTDSKDGLYPRVYMNSVFPFVRLYYCYYIPAEVPINWYVILFILAGCCLAICLLISLVRVIICVIKDVKKKKQSANSNTEAGRVTYATDEELVFLDGRNYNLRPEQLFYDDGQNSDPPEGRVFLPPIHPKAVQSTSVAEGETGASYDPRIFQTQASSGSIPQSKNYHDKSSNVSSGSPDHAQSYEDHLPSYEEVIRLKKAENN